MKPSVRLRQHREAVIRIAAEIGVLHVRMFGSVLRGEDTEESDIDLLVDAPKGITFFDMARLQRELEAELGVSVDVITPEDLSLGFRDQVVREACSL
ncbi:MAG: nucleotidyltransferase family protein [Thiobacillus sp.]